MQVFEAIDPLALASFLRGIKWPYNGPGSLEQFLPIERRPVMEYEFVRGQRVVPEVGRYRAWDTEAGISGRPGFDKITGSIPPLAEKMILSEEDRLRLQLTQFFTGSGMPQELVDQVFDDAANLARRIAARVEYARGQVLTTGKVTFTSTEADVKGAIDYTTTGRNIQTATASPLWSDTVNATPLADLRAWMETWRTNNDLELPGVILGSRRAKNALALTDDLKNAIFPYGSTPTSAVVNPTQIEAYLNSWGIPPIVEYETVVYVAGVSTRVIPDNVLIFLPSPGQFGGLTNSFGETLVGITTDGLDLARQLGQPVQVGIDFTGLTYKTFDPNHIWTKVSQLALPVLKDPGKILVATVL